MNAFRPAALLVALLLLAEGCGGGRPGEQPYPKGPRSGVPRKGGTLVFLRETDPDYLDPGLAYTVLGAPIVAALCRTLLGYSRDPDSNLTRLQPDMAESFPTVLDSGRVYAMKLRADERFGAPVLRHVTAADIKYSIERLFRIDSPGLSFYMNLEGAGDFAARRAKEIRGIVARGDSIYFRLVSPRPAFLYALGMTFSSPVPREVAEHHAQDYSQHIVSTGPYDLAEYVPRRHIILVRNPICRFQPMADTVHIRLGLTAENAVAQIRKGQADGGFFELPASEYARLKNDPATSKEVQVAQDLSVYYLALDTEVPPFTDVRVRRAVAYALDQRAQVKVWCGKGDEAHEILPEGMPGFAPGLLYRHRDLAKARELLKEAGYPNGVDVRFYTRNEEPDPRSAEVIQAELAEVGIRARLEIIDGASYWAVTGRPSNKFPMVLGSWIMDFPEGSDFFDVIFNGERITQVHNNNLSMYNVPEVNAAIDRNLAELDPGKRAAEWTRIDRRIMSDSPIVPYLHARNTRFYSRRVGGYFYHPIRVLYLDRVYVKRPEAPAS